MSEVAVTREHLAGLELVLTELQSSLHRTQYDQLTGLIAQASAAPDQGAVGMRFRRNDGRDRAWTHSPRTEPLGSGYEWELTYTHADPSELERLRAELEAESKGADRAAEAMLHWKEEADSIREQLAKAQALLRKLAANPTGSIKHYIGSIDAFLSATAQPADDMCNHDNPEARCICREEFGHRVCVQPTELKS